MKKYLEELLQDNKEDVIKISSSIVRTIISELESNERGFMQVTLEEMLYIHACWDYVDIVEVDSDGGDNDVIMHKKRISLIRNDETLKKYLNNYVVGTKIITYEDKISGWQSWHYGLKIFISEIAKNES